MLRGDAVSSIALVIFVIGVILGGSEILGVSSWWVLESCGSPPDANISLTVDENYIANAVDKYREFVACESRANTQRLAISAGATGVLTALILWIAGKKEKAE